MPRRLLLATGSGSVVAPAVMPTNWGLVREATNPVINVANNPAEIYEQYVPAPIRLTNGDIWVYVKGNSVIYAWKSTDGVTFSLQNSGAAVVGHGAGGTWDSNFALEPFAIYDADSDVIHLWYKGRNASLTAWAWGHATAPGSTPTVFTKDAANPILTSSTVSAALGGATIGDLAISDVYMVGSTYHFDGYALVGSRYKMIGATGTTWNDPTGVAVIVAAASDATIIYKGSVFRVPGSGPAVYGMLYSRGDIDFDPLTIRAATSSDGSTWDFSSTADVLTPPGGSAWDATTDYAAALLRQPHAPYTSPYIDSLGRWLFYFSGEKVASPSGYANVGLAYLSPT